LISRRAALIVLAFVDEKKVLSEIEFYLPQLAHMIIHLDIDWYLFIH
jgi:hypothetical protein